MEAKIKVSQMWFMNDCLKGTYIIVMQRGGIALLHFWAITMVSEIENIPKSKYEIST